MLNILLVCSGGMSTSILVKKMQEAAEAKNIEVNIWAVGESQTDSEVLKADIVLLAPQAKYLKDKMINKVNSEKPVELIDMRTYGMMKGDLALDAALEALENFKSS